MAISSIGVGSGLPLDQLLQDMRRVENFPLDAIKQRQDASKARISAYGTMKGSLENLQKAANVLSKTDTFGALKASSSNDSALGITATNKAIAGNYAIKVESMASAHSMVAAGLASRTDQNGTGGTISIELENGTSHSIELGSDTSLNGIMNAINNDPDSGVQATMVNDGSGTPYRLMLTSSETGENAAVKAINVTGNNDLNFLNYDKDTNSAQSGGYTVNAASNAVLDVNGIQVISQTNTIENVIDGVTLNVKDIPTSTAPIQVKLERDDSVALKAVNEFVKAYNDAQKTIRSLTSYDVAAQKGAALSGDSLARRASSDISAALQVNMSEGDLRSLSSMGITTDPKTGDLKIDEKKLESSLANNLDDVVNLFTNKETGLAQKMDKTLEEYTRFTGSIKNATDSANNNMRMLQDQYDATADRIDLKMENLRKQFVNLDVMVNQMNGMSSYLTQQLSMLGNMNNNKS